MESKQGPGHEAPPNSPDNLEIGQNLFDQKAFNWIGKLEGDISLTKKREVVTKVSCWVAKFLIEDPELGEKRVLPIFDPGRVRQIMNQAVLDFIYDEKIIRQFKKNFEDKKKLLDQIAGHIIEDPFRALYIQDSHEQYFLGGEQRPAPFRKNNLLLPKKYETFKQAKIQSLSRHLGIRYSGLGEITAPMGFATEPSAPEGKIGRAREIKEQVSADVRREKVKTIKVGERKT